MASSISSCKRKDGGQLGGAAAAPSPRASQNPVLGPEIQKVVPEFPGMEGGGREAGPLWES